MFWTRQQTLSMDGSKAKSPHVRTKTFHVDLYHWRYFTRSVQRIQKSPGGRGNRWADPVLELETVIPPIGDSSALLESVCAHAV